MNKHISLFFSILFNFVVSKQDIPNLLVDLQSVNPKYSSFGIQLEVPGYRIEAWELEFQGKADRMLENILSYVFDNQENPMETICAALMKIHKCNLAEELKLKYGATQGNNHVESL